MATDAGTGLSTATEAIPAARQAAEEALRRAGVTRADWGLVFATSAHRPQFAAILAEIQKVLGTESIAGCSAWGVLAGAQEIEGRPAVAVLAVRSDRIVGTTLYASLEGERLDEAARALAGQAAAGRNDLLVLLPDPFATRPDHLLAALERVAPDAVAVGAAASADPSLDRTFQFIGRNVATRAVSGVRLGGRLRHAIGITQGCQPLGAPCRVTRGDGNVILELDARPALEVLRSRLPPSLRDSLPRLAGHLFIGVPPDPTQERIEPGEYLVRHLVGLDEDRGALIVGSTMHEGQLLVPVLREGGAAREDLKDMLRRLSASLHGTVPRFGLYFNCAARGTSLYGLPGIDAAYLSGTFGELPIAGFFGNAEIAPLRGRNRVFTYTGVLALLGEAA